MKISYLVNCFLAITVVSVTAQPATSFELKYLTTEASLASKMKQSKDWSAMKMVQKGGQSADSFHNDSLQIAGAPQPVAAAAFLNGVTTIQMGNSVGYVDGSGRFMGLTTP